VTFDLSGNPNQLPRVKPLRVSAAGETEDFTQDHYVGFRDQHNQAAVRRLPGRAIVCDAIDCRGRERVTHYDHSELETRALTRGSLGGANGTS
jgi:hypothetical protein